MLKPRISYSSDLDDTGLSSMVYLLLLYSTSMNGNIWRYNIFQCYLIEARTYVYIGTYTIWKVTLSFLLIQLQLTQMLIETSIICDQNTYGNYFIMLIYSYLITCLFIYLRPTLSMPSCRYSYTLLLHLFLSCKHYLLGLISQVLNLGFEKTKGELAPIKNPYFIDQGE